MTDVDLIEQSIRDATFAIAADWEESLHGKRDGGRSGSVTGTREPPPPVPLSTIDDRAECCDRLAGWALLIAEERDLRPGINVRDAVNLARWVAIHAQWLAAHAAGKYAAQELADSARKIERLARPERRDYIVIGECPVSVAVDGSPEPCGAKVRAYTEKNIIQCSGCGTEDTLAWWESQIVPNLEEKALLTVSELVVFLHQQKAGAVTETAIRQWATRGYIRRHGRDVKGRTLYDRLAVLAWVSVKEREAA